MADLIPALKEIISKYFTDGMTYIEILEFLRVHHNYNISLSTLKRYFRSEDMKKRPLVNVRSSVQMITDKIKEELASSGALLGYRRMHKSLTSKGIVCRREDVRRILKDLDPEGVKLRRHRRLRRRKYRTPGPNYVWHIDGHDKLKPFGFSIHGCIDGFSRRIIWLEVSTSNKSPEVVASYYLKAVSELEGVPLVIKADDGTEHALIEPMQIYLRSLSDDTENVASSFSITTSPQNQRIESYWALLQRDRIGWWRRFLQDATDVDILFTSDPVMLDCIRYCFMALIRKDLKSVSEEWNAHIISRSRNGGPSGRPNTMYFLPHLYETQNYLQHVENDEYSDFSPIIEHEKRDYSVEFQEFAEYFMNEHEMTAPSTPEEALNLYIFLLEKIADFS